MSQQLKPVDTSVIQRLQSLVPTLVEQYKADPAAAQAVFRANTRVIHGFKTESTSREFQNLVDEPESLGGSNAGPNPVELLLGTLGTCQEIVLVAYAAVLGIELDEVTIEVSGELDLRGLFAVADVPAGFTEITFDATLKSSTATPQQLEQLKTLGLAHCPVLDTLQRPVKVTNTYTLLTQDSAA